MSRVISLVSHDKPSTSCSGRLFVELLCSSQVCYRSPNVQGRSGCESLAVFERGDERLDHLGAGEVSVEGVELVQPEVVAVKVCIWAGVWIAPQITEVLHQDKGAIELGVGKVLILSDGAQHLRARLHACC